ncbi:MAG: hypothetical protein CMG47_01050 [Candidatus Marinimicrobia bacterium]|nr:hypothetical protein [Candidatus Neomarinimicrobiota bacterium]
MKYILQILFITIFVSSCSFVVKKTANIQNINLVTGQHLIGTKRMVWIDSTRTNWFLDGYGPYRQLMAQIWYPADASALLSSVKKSKYIDNKKALTYTIELQGYKIPEILTNQIGSIKCNSWEDASPVSNKKFPILIFSHGHGGLRTQNTNQVEELVSHGYIVIAVDHTYDAGFVEFPDGNIAYSLTSKPEGERLNETPETFYTRFGYRVDDIDFVINKIDSFDDYDLSISAIMDKNNIGIFGHSFGCLTSVYATYFNDRIKSCFGLDGWFEPLHDSLVFKNINKPIMHLGQNNKGDEQFWNDINFVKMNNFIKSNSDLSVMVDIPGSHHYDYTDFTYFSYIAKKLNFSGTVSTKKMAKIMNVTLLDFFNYTLKDDKKINLDNYKKEFPEIDIIYSNINN